MALSASFLYVSALDKYSTENLISNLKLLSDLKSLAGSYSKRDLFNFLTKIDSAKRYLAANVNPKLTLENLVLNF